MSSTAFSDNMSSENSTAFIFLFDSHFNYFQCLDFNCHSQRFHLLHVHWHVDCFHLFLSNLHFSDFYLSLQLHFNWSRCLHINCSASLQLTAQRFYALSLQTTLSFKLHLSLLQPFEVYTSTKLSSVFVACTLPTLTHFNCVSATAISHASMCTKFQLFTLQLSLTAFTSYFLNELSWTQCLHFISQLNCFQHFYFNRNLSSIINLQLTNQLQPQLQQS